MSIEYVDKLGQPIKEGDCVAWPDHNTLQVGLIVKVNLKTVKVKLIEPPKKWQPVTWNKYPHNVIRLNGSAVSMYILKLSSTKE